MQQPHNTECPRWKKAMLKKAEGFYLYSLVFLWQVDSDWFTKHQGRCCWIIFHCSLGIFSGWHFNKCLKSHKIKLRAALSGIYFCFKFSKPSMLPLKNNCIRTEISFLVTTWTDLCRTWHKFQTLYLGAQAKLLFVYIPPRLGFKTYNCFLLSPLLCYCFFSHFQVRPTP